MSCNLTDYKQVDYLVSVISYFNNNFNHERKQIVSPLCIQLNGIEVRTKLGKDMLKLSCKAFLKAYEGRHWREIVECRPSKYKSNFILAGDNTNIIQFYKSLQYFIYQCSEYSEDEKPMLLRQLENVLTNLAHYIIENTKEYEEAKWN